MLFGRRPLRAVLYCGFVALLTGCVNPTSFLNPEFLNSLNPTGQPANLPGDAPALLVRTENRTSRNVTFVISYRAQSDVVNTYSVDVSAGDSSAQALVCPISEITLGDVSNLERVGVQVMLGDGTANDAFIEVESFGVLLKRGVNYDCGDSITFVVQPSGATRSGFITLAFFNSGQ